MSNQYFDLRRIYGYYIDKYNAIYQLTTENEEELNKIYQMIGTNLINKRRYLSKTIIRNILNIIPYKNRYTKFYLELAKCIYDEYHVKEVKGVSAISNYLFYKEFRIQLETSYIFEEINTDNLAIHTEDSIYRAIMYNDLKIFIAFTEKEGFDIDQRLNCDLYPTTSVGYSLLELCCYHGAVDCFKFLLTKFKSRITQKCLQLSFLSGKPDILNECLKYRKPDNDCMMYAIISHNIDFVTFLMNEFNIEINLEICGFSQNLESFLVYFDQTNDINRCFAYSAMFFIPSLCEYFLSHDAIIEEKGEFCKTNLYYAAENNSNKIAELLKPDYANIKKKDVNRKNALHIAAEINSKEITKLRISYGANINEIDDYGETALHIAALNNSKETAKLLLSYQANFFKKDRFGRTAFHYAACNNSKEMVKIFISYGVKINIKGKSGETALHMATLYNRKETAELLLMHGANINENYSDGQTALHYATYNNNKEMVELFISYGANIDEKNNKGKTALHIAAEKNCKEIAELLLSYGANIRKKDNDGRTAFSIAAENNSKETAEFLFSYGK